MFYIVEHRDGEDWLVFSRHRNKIYAEIQFDLLVKRQPAISVRLVYNKKVIKEV